MKKILVTNDDGVRSEGIHALARALKHLGEVIVVGPQTEASAIGHALTLRRPLRMELLEEGVYEVDGTPTDCVNIAITQLYKPSGAMPDLVVSGINKGYNLGDDVTYSGTVAGALEAALLGIPGIAVSLRTEPRHLRFQRQPRQPRAQRRRARPAAGPRAAHVSERQRAVGSAKGHARHLPGQAQPRHRRRRPDRPARKPYYWIEEGEDAWEPHDQSDYQAVKDGYVSVTPLQPDLTAYDELASAAERSWLSWLDQP